VDKPVDKPVPKRDGAVTAGGSGEIGKLKTENVKRERLKSERVVPILFATTKTRAQVIFDVHHGNASLCTLWSLGSVAESNRLLVSFGS